MGASIAAAIPHSMESKTVRALSPPAKRVVPSGMCFEYTVFRNMPIGKVSGPGSYPGCHWVRYPLLVLCM